MIKLTDKLTEKIQSYFIGSRYRGDLATEDMLTELVGEKAHCYDKVIDDGADYDETEDVYVMRACFDFDNCDIVVHIYYGDVTEEIGYVDVAEY